MAIIDMKRKWSGDEAEAAPTGTAQLSWSITVDDPANDTAESVKSSATPDNPHPDDEDMILASFRVRRLSPIYFELDARYTKDPTGSKGLTPTERPVVVTQPSVGFATTEEPVDVDADGDPLCTANGEGYDPPCLEEFNDLILVFEKNVSTVDYLEYRSLKGSVSETGFYGFPGGEARCLDISANPAQEGDELYYKQRTTIAFRKPHADSISAFAWFRRILHEGFYERLDDDRIVRALDDHGEPTTRPVLLDQEGKRTTVDFPAWRYHKRFPFVDFAAYNII